MSGTTWVDGHFIGGHVALDFSNTVYRRLPELGAELLDSPATFREWLARVALLPESAGEIDQAMLVTSIDLRSALWQAFDAHREGRPVPPTALARILQHARRKAEEVSVDEHGSVSAATPQAAVAALAISTLQLLLNPPTPAVRACDACGWFFIDTSRSRRRRWCSMQTCGNEHKVARYRAAHAGQQAEPSSRSTSR